MLLRCTIVAAAFAIHYQCVLDADDARVDFAREVLPVLSNKCFVCHGPDPVEDTDLRLDLPQQATADRGGFRAIDPATPGKSEVLARIHSSDEPMPPADAEKQLTETERDILSRWIRQGGEYAQHWAFVKPVANPELAKAESDRSVIDHLIGAQLQREGIDFAASADPVTLARRVALTLTGLPPEQEQLDRYLKAQSDTAYEQLVNELLDSPRFGEHQARFWLDAVRYGDTHGLHLDNRRGIYPYRDWVVRALNENLPFDDFITWQIAGDLLPDASLAQRIATGYVRLNPSTGEGGAISDEFQAKNNFDRVENFGTVFLGMSLTCARCHNHKYDPISQSEYYRLLAFFNNTSEPALDGNSYTYGPTVKTPSDQSSWKRWRTLTTERDQFLETAEAHIKKKVDLSKTVAYAESLAGWKASNWQISSLVNRDASVPSTWTKVGGLPGSLSGRSARGKLPNVKQAVWVSFDLDVPHGQSLLLTFSGGPGSKVFLANSAESIATKTSDERIAIIPLQFETGKHQVRLKIEGASVSEIECSLLNPWSELAKSKDWYACSKQNRLRMLSDAGGPLASLGLGQQANALSNQLRSVEAGFTTTLVAQELPQPRVTHLLKRGEYDLPVGDPLQPGILNVMSAFPDGAPSNRLGLAKWLTSREHPLVSRVLINRVWSSVFGTGLVRTPEDFGLQGQQPTHPELLDWLAVEFQESGWDFKKMIRTMVLSRTFRQSSAWRPSVDDPDNRLYARGPGYRMDAEVIRDMGLWASKLLDPAMGGEGVKPYQPDGMWLALAHPASNTKQYRRDAGQRLYRRSLYVYWKRTSPHPMMTLFDAPDRESSCVRRSRTNTSLQSLGLLNETQRVEMARMLAERLMREADTDQQRLNLLFRLLACRSPTEVERAACDGLLWAMQERFASAPDDALKLLSSGEAPRTETLDTAMHAAWTQVAATVLASDVAIMLY